jgi:hypothetical protein
MAHHPIKQASDIAKLLCYDPIAAGMVKEHINPAELRDLLNIDKSTEEFFEGITNTQLLDEVADRIDTLQDCDVMTRAALGIVKNSLL